MVTTDNSDWATNCPEYKVTAVQAFKVTGMSDWQKKFTEFTEGADRFLESSALARDRELTQAPAMDIEKLVRMANQIAANSDYGPDKESSPRPSPII